MYSNERGSRFNVLDIFIKIIFAAVFIGILVWLFPKVPNMTAFYSNVFRENIKYMQEAGESYFTTDLLPNEIGKEVKISLSEMFEKKLILPFVDEDGNSCNQYDSYVSVTKTEDGYELKTNLVCNNESDYTIKILGCHEYCKDDSCNKTCSATKITQYQYKKKVTKDVTSYSCKSGYTLKGKYCYKTEIVDTKSAKVDTVTTKDHVVAAKLVVVGGTKTLLQTIVTQSPSSKVKTYVDAITETTPGTTTIQKVCTQKQIKVPYTEYEVTIEQSCTTTTKTTTYKCNCTTYRDSDGKSVTTCSTCTKSIPVETCKDVPVRTPIIKYRYETVTECNDVTITNPGTTKTYCPTIATGKETVDGKLLCFYYKIIEGSKTYSCPSDTTNTEGKDETLKCYKVTNGTSYYKCEDSSYTLKSDNMCHKTITGTSTELKCNDGYKLEGNICNKYNTTKIKATKSSKTKTSYSYKWSEKETLSGWTKTDKTKTVNGDVVCE